MVELSTAQLEELLAKLAGHLPAETYRLVETLLRTFQWLIGALEAKNTTLGRLRRMIFGATNREDSQLCCPGRQRRRRTPATKPKPKATAAKPPRIIREPKRLPGASPQAPPGRPLPQVPQGQTLPA